MRLPYISPIPRLYLAYISPLSRSGDDASRRASLEGLRVGRALLDAISSGDPNPNPNPSPSPNPTLTLTLALTLALTSTLTPTLTLTLTLILTR